MYGKGPLLFGDTPRIFGDGPLLFGDTPRIFGDGLLLFGDTLRIFGDGPLLFGDTPHIIGDGLLLFGDTLRIFGDGPLLFGDTPRIFGDGPLLFGDTLRIFGDGPLLFGDTPRIFGDGLLLFGDTLRIFGYDPLLFGVTPRIFGEAPVLFRILFPEIPKPTMSFLKKLFTKPAQTVPEPLNREAFFHTHKKRLYPWVKLLVSDNEPLDPAKAFEFRNETEPVHKRWLGDLVIMYVFDMNDRFQVLLKHDLPATISGAELHRLAIENLHRDVEFKVHQTNFGGYMVTAGGDHEAGVICIPGLWQSLADHIGDSLVVGIPSKDLVLIAPASDMDVIANLKILVHETFKDGERLLTSNIFEYNKNQATWKLVDNITRS